VSGRVVRYNKLARSESHLHICLALSCPLQQGAVKGRYVALAVDATTTFAAIVTGEHNRTGRDPDDAAAANTFPTGRATDEWYLGLALARMATAGTIPTCKVELRCIERFVFSPHCRAFGFLCCHAHTSCIKSFTMGLRILMSCISLWSYFPHNKNAESVGWLKTTQDDAESFASARTTEHQLAEFGCLSDTKPACGACRPNRAVLDARRGHLTLLHRR
jgi:hypothetical protein